MLAVFVPAAAAVAILAASPFWSPQPSPIADAPVVSPTRQGRTPVDLRPGLARPALRSLSLRGHPVQLGQGTLEASLDDGPTTPFVLEHTDVVAEVTGFVSAVTVTQRFKNPFTKPVEAIYVFPLPENAGVDEMTLTAGTRVIRATIQKRAEARRMYEAAKSQGRRAALLDQERPNIFTQSVANLLPGESVQVSLRYVAPLRFDDGAYTFNFPMTVGPRYVPGAPLDGQSQGSGTVPDSDRVDDASRITPPVERTGRDISVEVRLEAGTVIEDLWSVSHRLQSERPSSSRAVVSLDPSDRVPNKDLILRWRVSGAEKRAAVVSSGGSEGTFALMLNPEAQPLSAEVMPKEMVFVIDTSCSMAGPPLDAAKRAMTLAMEQMNPRDTFMLIDFADRASTFHDAPLPNTAQNVSKALKYLRALPSGGGTNQLDGIRRALDRPADPTRLRMVLLMTDGFIGNEREIFTETKRLLRDARVFSFGIGSSVNHFLLNRLAEEGRGFSETIRTDEDPGVAVERFVRRVAKPLLTDITIDWGGLQVVDVLPRRVPDLFDAQPVIVMGRYRSTGTANVTLRGRVGGRPVELVTPVSFQAAKTASGLTTMWARARVEEIDRLEKFGEFAEAAKEITTLGLEYHLVTEFTSFVAVDEARVTNDATNQVVVPTEPAEGTEGEGRDTGLVKLRHNTIQIIRSPNTTPVVPPTTVPIAPGRYKVALDGNAPEAVAPGPRTTTTAASPAPTPVTGGDDFDGDRGGTGERNDVSGSQSGGAVPKPRVMVVLDTSRSMLEPTNSEPTTTPVAPTGKPPSKFDTGKRSGVSADYLAQPVTTSSPDPTPKTVKGEENESFDNLFGDGKRQTANKKPDLYVPPPPVNPMPGDGWLQTLSQSDILGVVSADKQQLGACAEAQRRLNPGLTGRLVMKWTIRLDGTVSNVTVVTTEFAKTPFAACVMKRIKTWRFPRHTVPGEPVQFPFKF
ncbi:MAG: VIT domain-containing protein [Myxococcales bacterium]|nr:VIT domain-containing protein [Myxococcales bacterium]